ncbi:hypothetical protein A9Q94_10440 [Rhodobacterales bacterium 56_14_T64]|nr:hypothetical protein A9Q94_10440 [Rhodobacterales bacterium 56_14_T64]
MLPKNLLYRLDLEMKGLPKRTLQNALTDAKLEDGEIFWTNTILFVRHIKTGEITIQDDLMEFEDVTCTVARFLNFIENRY